MSLEAHRKEAERWLKTAEEDLKAAEVLMRNEQFAHACFFCQQAGEKGIKALYYALGGDPWGHSIAKLIDDLQQISLSAYREVLSLREKGLVLDRFYIPTRYPNGLPDLTPGEAYLKSDAEEGIRLASAILEAVRGLI